MNAREMIAMIEQERASLCAERESLDKIVARIEAQVRQARSQVWTDGEFADPEWFARATNALGFRRKDLRLVNRRINEIDQRLRELRKRANVAESEVRNSEAAAMFVRAARRMLTDRTYRSIWDAVNREQRAGAIGEVATRIEGSSS